LKRSKIVLLSLCFVLVAALLAACGNNNSGDNTPAASAPASSGAATTPASQAAAGDKKITVGVIFQDLSNEFIAMLKDSVVKRAENYPNLKLIINDGEGKAEKQIMQMETFVSQKVDAIIINPRDGNALIPAVEAAVKAGVPVITLSSDVEQDVGQVWVGSENEQGGAVEAQYVVDKLGGKGNIAVLRGPIGAYAEIGRFKGYESVFKNYPDIKVVFDQTANWSRDEGMSLMENWIQSGKQIDGVLAQNDEMALGALKAIEDSGLLGKIVVGGVDAIPDALNSIKEGKLDASAFQDSIGQAFGSVDMAVKAANGEKIERNNIPFELVTKDNVEPYFDRIKLK
jgi:inositol transport system substrate-binding protein